MRIVYGYLGWNIQLDDEENLRSDVRDINALLKQLSQNAPEVHMSDVQSVNALGFLIVARDLDIPQGNTQRIVGMATLVEKRHLMGRSGIVEDVAVDEAYRGHGIGEKLNEILVSLAVKRGLSHIDLTSSPGRVAANKLYQKLGYERRETNVYRKKLN